MLLALKPPKPAPADDIDWETTSTYVGAVVVAVILVVLMIWQGRGERRRLAEADARAAQARAAAAAEEARRRAAWEAQEAERRRQEEAAIRQRAEELASRFGLHVAQRIMNREIWVGMTADMLVESRGRPADVDEKVLKTKTKHVFKYDHQGGAKYGLRITLDDGVVVGWDDKR